MPKAFINTRDLNSAKDPALDSGVRVIIQTYKIRRNLRYADCSAGCGGAKGHQEISCVVL